MMLFDRTIKFWVLAALIAFVCLPHAGCDLISKNRSDHPEMVRVRISRVIDGDTAYAVFPGGLEEKIRFIGIDAPEINHPVNGMEPYGPEAEARSLSKGLWGLQE